MTPLEQLEERRQRGLDEVRDLESLLARRPLFGFEERALEMSRSLVKEMDDAIRAHVCESMAKPRVTPAFASTQEQAGPRRP